MWKFSIFLTFFLLCIVVILHNTNINRNNIIESFKNPTLSEKPKNDVRLNMNMSPLYYAAYNQENPNPWQTWELNTENPGNQIGVTWHAKSSMDSDPMDSSWGFGANGDWILNSRDPNGTVSIQPRSGKTTIGKSSPSENNTLSVDSGITVENNYIQTYSKNNWNNRFIMGNFDKNYASIYDDKNGLNIYHPQKNTNFLTDTNTSELHASNSVQSNTASCVDKNNTLEFQSNSDQNEKNNISNQSDGLHIDADVVTINDTLNVNSKLCINSTCITPELLYSTLGKLACSNSKPTFIYIGSSKNRVKIVPSKLPLFYKLPLYPIPHNSQKSYWRDRFSVTRASNGSFIVTRIDKNEGWGQPLMFKISSYC